MEGWRRLFEGLYGGQQRKIFVGSTKPVTAIDAWDFSAWITPCFSSKFPVDLNIHVYIKRRNFLIILFYRKYDVGQGDIQIEFSIENRLQKAPFSCQAFSSSDFSIAPHEMLL